MSKLSFALSILVLHFTYHSIQAQPGETKTGTATVSGLVKLKGEPAQGVEVILVTEIRWSASAPRVRTDEKGRFLFPNVAAGSYEVFAVAPGYVSPVEMHSVADGAKVDNVDLEIKRGGVIAGRIIDSRGRPVIEEIITLKKLDTPQIYSSYNPNFRMNWTDDRGVYRIYGLPAGRYLVSVGYAPDAPAVAESRRFYPRVFYPDVTSESAAKVIEVSEGSEVTDVDITVPDPEETRELSGRVVDADTGEPIEGVTIEVRGLSSDGSPGDGSHESESGPNGMFHVSGLIPGKWQSEIHGVYRLYGLLPGTYVVCTHNRFSPFPSPYDKDGPTYYPSSTRETAAEVTVTGGGEASGIDIHYRGERGHAVSGSVSFSGEPVPSFVSSMVALTNTVTGVVRSDADFVRGRFAIYGVPDGEYEITVRRILPSDEEIIVSSPRRVVVKGADVGGIELKELSLGVMAGKFALEATPVVCESARKWSLEEMLLAIRPRAKSEDAIPPRNRATIVNGLTEKGEFTVYGLAADRYFLEPRLPNENWYVKAITAPASTSASANTRAAARDALVVDISRNGITLKAGEKKTGVVATIADGAARLSGKVVPTSGGGEGSRLPARLLIHLVPAEAGSANEVLRYAEVLARGDGSFLLSNIHPGKYWLIARAAPVDDVNDSPVAPLAWDATERAKLYHEAMAAKNEIELRPCERIKDYVLRFNFELR